MRVRTGSSGDSGPGTRVLVLVSLSEHLVETREVPTERVAYGDRTLPIHARTRGVSVPPQSTLQVMGMY